MLCRGALLLFPEERYYGESQPFGKDSLAPQNAVYLSTEQVLADYALLLTTVKEQLNASTCPVVAFGGSYGGTLTTYFRRQYPALTVGGLAASAPVGYYSHNAWDQHRISEYTWIDIVQQVFSSTEHGGPACFSKLQAIVDAVATAGSTPAGLAKLAGQMHVCAPEVLGKDPIFLLTDALETLPQEVHYCFSAPKHNVCSQYFPGVFCHRCLRRKFPPTLSFRVRRITRTLSEVCRHGLSTPPVRL